MNIARAEVYRYVLNLRPGVTVAGRPLETRAGLLLKLANEDGAVGWGEAAPLPGFSMEPFERARDEMLRCARRLDKYLLPTSYSELEGAGLVKIDGFSSVSFAVEAAYFNLRAAMEGVATHAYLNPAAPGRLPLNALLQGDDAAVRAQAARVAAEGYPAAKLKVGGAPAGAIARVCAVREALGAGVALRLDANRAWTRDEAFEVARAVADCGVEYIEEPLADPFQLPDFAEDSPIPYALDETLQHFHELLGGPSREQPVAEFAEKARALTRLFEGAAACVWKPTLMHVPNVAEDIQRGRFTFPIRKLVFSAAYESGVGIAAIAQYAAAYGDAHCPAGLDTYAMLDEDVLTHRLPLTGGVVSPSALHEAGARVAESHLERLYP